MQKLTDEQRMDLRQLKKHLLNAANSLLSAGRVLSCSSVLLSGLVAVAGEGKTSEIQSSLVGAMDEVDELIEEFTNIFLINSKSQ